jgi:glucose dehydrogenase
MQSGEVLWKMALPAGGQATPMTYRGKDGKQYMVVAPAAMAPLAQHQAIRLSRTRSTEQIFVISI